MQPCSSGSQQGSGAWIREATPACPELEEALGPAVVQELCRVLGALHDSLAATRRQAGGQGLSPGESSHDTLHSHASSPRGDKQDEPSLLR